MAGYLKRKETRHNQNAVKIHLNPRWLARSVAKGINRELNEKESEISSWREKVSKLPKSGRSRIHRKAEKQ